MTNYLEQEKKSTPIKVKNPGLTIVLYIFAIVAAVIGISLIYQNITAVIANIADTKAQYEAYGQPFVLEFDSYLLYTNHILTPFITYSAISLSLFGIGVIFKKISFLFNTKIAKIQQKAIDEMPVELNSEEITDEYESIFDEQNQVVEETIIQTDENIEETVNEISDDKQN